MHLYWPSHPGLKKIAITELFSGNPAVLHCRVIERFNHHTLIKVKLETGCTHQRRVHMAHIHHPLVGDKTYSDYFHLPKKASELLINCLCQFPSQALHAQCLGIIHPVTIIAYEMA